MASVKATKIPIPTLLYGTAWKKDQTRGLVKQAILNGFRGVDTAAQPKHYQEDLVGAGIRDALKEGGVTRADLYIQSKYTSVHGQDPKKMPYDPASSIEDQVKASVASSLHNLRHSEDSADQSYLDCLVLHSPFPSMGETKKAWREMEAFVPHSVRTLGISNCYDVSVLQNLYEFAAVKPAVVQNRFYRETGYDPAIRALCDENDITYQSFWTLTANPNLMRSEPVARVAAECKISQAVALYALVMGLGKVSVLNGTTNVSRMREDLEGVAAVEQWRTEKPQAWSKIHDQFMALLE